MTCSNSLITWSLHALIRVEPSIKFLRNEQVDSNSLVVFDLDDTLIQGIAFAPDDIKLGIRKTWYLINTALEKATTDAQKALVYAKLFKMKPELVEQEAPAIIRHLQHNNVKVIGLTASFAGLDNANRHRPCNADMRITHLRLVGINFYRAFSIEPIIFDELEDYGQRPAYSGVFYFHVHEKKDKF